MIALLVTVLLAVYVLGPDLLARWILGFIVPRKHLALSRSEEITRGVLWSIVPFIIAWLLRRVGPYAIPPTARIDLQVFFSGLYSEAFFNQHRPEFFSAAGSFVRLNVCLIVRMYTVVLVTAVAFDLLISRYGRIREGLRGRGGVWPFVRWALAIFVPPRIAEWHLILSPVLLPSTRMTIELDVLTKSGIVYSGRLADKMLAPGGELQSVTLESPRRFRRELYLEAQKEDPTTDPEEFWKPIPGNLFVILASEISTVNIRHIPAVRRFGERFEDIASALRQIAAKVQKLEGSRPGGPKAR